MSHRFLSFPIINSLLSIVSNPGNNYLATTNTALFNFQPEPIGDAFIPSEPAPSYASNISDCTIPYYTYDEKTSEYLDPPEAKEPDVKQPQITSSGLDKLNHENDYDKIIQEAGEEFDVDPALIKAVIRQESKFDKNAKNKRSTASGLMQMLKGTYEAYFRKANPGKQIVSSFDVKSNIRAGACYLKDLLNQFNGDVKKALLGYNQGAYGARKMLRDGKTDTAAGYVKSVFKYFEAYTKCLTT